MTIGDFVVHVDLSPAPRQSAAICVLAGFLVSFAFIRMSTRLMRSPTVPWWPGSIETEGGLHVHHLVFGIDLLMICGFLSFAVGPDEPWLQILAAGFGVGLGLTLDEFALWLHLDDVYWAEEGRQSVDAVVIAALLGGLVVLGFTPFGGDDTGSVLAVIAALAFVLSLSLVTARRRYPADGEKVARATARYERAAERRRRWADRIGGAPTSAESRERSSK